MTVTFVPVVDLSRNQGPTNFVKMKASGVRGLILRVGNGRTVDDHFEGFYHGSLAAGFTPEDITFYSFVNPKRGTGAQCAVAMLDEIHRVVGHVEVGYMADCEWYAAESPNPGLAPIYGSAYAAWLREHRATVHREAPRARQFGYSDLAFWNGPISRVSKLVWCGDDQLAAEIDWIVPRYPAYSDAAYAHYGYPGAPDTWADWAFNAQPQGPLPPRGGTWLGWQPSAGWNRQGALYGVTSRDLDLNIVHPDAWARWTGRTVPIPQPQPQLEGDDMLRFLAPTDSPARFYAMCDTAGRALRCEWTGDGGDQAVLDRIDFYRNAHPIGTVPFEMSLTLGAFQYISLDGPLPQGFTPDQFANPGEIKARSGSADAAAVVQLVEAVGRLGQNQGSAAIELKRAAEALAGGG